MQASSNENHFFRNKFTTPGAFLAGVLLFFLPFVEIKCNGTTLAHNSGLGLAIGSDFKESNEMRSLGNSMKNSFGDEQVTVKSEKKENEGKMYALALGALVLGVIGLIISYTNARSGKTTMIIGILSAIALIIVMIQVKADLKTKSSTGNEDAFSRGMITAEFTIWYYLALLAFLAAAFFSYKREQPDTVGATPPKNAPQLHIDNPGDQSNFPKSASESELG